MGTVKSYNNPLSKRLFSILTAVKNGSPYIMLSAFYLDLWLSYDKPLHNTNNDKSWNHANYQYNRDNMII